jgi:hypothetical protein
MKLLKLLSATLFCMGISHDVMARAAPSTHVRVVTSAEMLSAVALNAAAGTRTATITIAKNWAKLRFALQFTHNAATTVTSQFTCSYDGTTYYRRVTRECASGTCTVYEQSDSLAVTGDVDFELEYDVRGCEKVKLLLGGASAGASDLVTTQAVAITGD